MRKFLLTTAITLGLAACSEGRVETAQASAPTSKTAQVDENQRIDAWFETHFQEEARQYPEFLAQLGIDERTAEWNDRSREAYLEGLERTRQNLETFKAEFDRDALDPDRQLSYDLYVRNAEQELAGREWADYNYAFNQMFGAQSRVPTFLLNQHRIKDESDARDYIARLRGVDEMLGQVVDNAKRSAEAGIQPPKFVYAHVMRDIDNITSGAPFEADAELHPLLANFQEKVDALNLPEETREDLFAEAIDAMETDFKRGYDLVEAEMERQLKTATTDDGVWKLPRGDEYYADRLARMTTTDMTADEIHDLGLAEVERIQNEMREIMAAVGFEGDLQDFYEFMRTDPQFVYEDSDEGRQAYLSDATDMIDTMGERLGEVFLDEPKAPLEVRAVEAFREQSAGKAFYNRPSMDGSRPGIYYANLYRIGDMPSYQMEALAYHEGIPGHHMQLAMAQEMDGVPMFRKMNRVTAYTEGWGLYSEYLPKEMGFYEDPYSDFGRLAMEIWRAARLVVDTGLHHKEWSREKAIQYLKDNTPNPEGDIVKAIERYIVMPGQATAYKVGMLKILEEREKAKTALGDAFDIREFHDVILSSGPVPLEVMERRVDDYIARTQAS